MNGQAQSGKQDFVIYKNPKRYCAFPMLIKDNNDMLWVDFSWNTTRSHYGKAAGGEAGFLTVFSSDNGRNWMTQGESPKYVNAPDAARYFGFQDSTIIDIWPLMHEILPPSRREEFIKNGVEIIDWSNGTFSASYRVVMNRKKAGSQKWETTYPKVPSIASVGGFGKGCLLDDGTILKPIYGKATIKESGSHAWALRSADKGNTWQLISIAYDGKLTFNETELLKLQNGNVIAMIRCQDDDSFWDNGFLRQSESNDYGKTWSTPVKTKIWGYPADLLLLRDGTILCTYGYRRLPYGIRACFSFDGGKTWDWKHEVILRSDAIPPKEGKYKFFTGDFGYPRSVELSDESIITVYYITGSDGVTHIEGSRWSRDYFGPSEFPRGADAFPDPDLSLLPENITGETYPLKMESTVAQSFIPKDSMIAAVAIRLSQKNKKEPIVHTNGLWFGIRIPDGNKWYTDFIVQSSVIPMNQIMETGWIMLPLQKPIRVVPGQVYVLTLYNADYISGAEPKLKLGLNGDHSWYINTGSFTGKDYPNGGIGPYDRTDIAFKIYSRMGPLPKN